MPVEWKRVRERIDSGRTVYWNADTPRWRLAVSRVDFATPGSPWRFKAYRLDGSNRAGQKAHESEPVGTVTQARKAAETWLAEHTKEG
jgi:hypothetical protein